MRNVVDKICKGNQNTRIVFNNCFQKIVPLWDNVEIYCKAGQAIDDNTAQAHFMLDTYVYKYTIRICNIIVFHCNNYCTKAPQCYLIRTLSLFY